MLVATVRYENIKEKLWLLWFVKEQQLFLVLYSEDWTLE